MAKERWQQRANLENQLKILKKKSGWGCWFKNELDGIYDHIAEGIDIRSKCDWYEHSKKSAKFFLNVEKRRGVQTQ